MKEKNELISLDKAKEIYTNKFFENHTDEMKNAFEHMIIGAYHSGYNTVLMAYENLFGLDENYWKLVDYLDKKVWND